jgi:hypothetical protein
VIWWLRSWENFSYPSVEQSLKEEDDWHRLGLLLADWAALMGCTE